MTQIYEEEVGIALPATLIEDNETSNDSGEGKNFDPAECELSELIEYFERDIFGDTENKKPSSKQVSMKVLPHNTQEEDSYDCSEFKVQLNDGTNNSSSGCLTYDFGIIWVKDIIAVLNSWDIDIIPGLEVVINTEEEIAPANLGDVMTVYYPNCE